MPTVAERFAYEPARRTLYVDFEPLTLRSRDDVEDDWAAMVREMVDRYCRQVVRCSTSGFLRAKLGPALATRGVTPRLYESERDARAGLAGDDAS